MIALAIRPWRLNAAVTALRAAFPGAKVHIRHYDPRAGFADFAVGQPVTITDDRELLSMTTSWAPRRLRVTAADAPLCWLRSVTAGSRLASGTEASQTRVHRATPPPSYRLATEHTGPCWRSGNPVRPRHSQRRWFWS